MDLWAIAAATGAAYAAKNLQNSSADQKESLVSYRVQSESNCPLQRLAENDAFEAMGSLPRANFSEFNEGSSARDVEFSVPFISDEEDDALLGGNGISAEVKFGYQLRDLGRVKLSRRAHLRLIKSREPDAHMLKEHRNFTIPSSSTCLNTDDSSERYELLHHYKERWKIDVGLSDVVTMLGYEPVKEHKSQSRTPSSNLRGNGCGDSMSVRDAMLLFITGMTMGILLAAKTSKNDLNHTSKHLVQMDGMFQDLHDKVETIEKLVYEERTQAKDSPSSVSFPNEEEKTEKHVEIFDGDVTLSDANKSENAELMRKIEGELQFELELLEQSINASSSAPERSSDAVDEIDSDMEIEVVRGDLKMAQEITMLDEPEKEQTDNFNNPQPLNYAVSPWELTLRLHELIEHRLQARVEELETALHENTDRNRVGVVDSRFHYNVPRDRLMGTRTLPWSVNFQGNYPEVYEVYNGSVEMVKEKNKVNKNGELRKKALDQRKPFIRPKI